jgi:hypothetical protein
MVKQLVVKRKVVMLDQSLPGRGRHKECSDYLTVAEGSKTLSERLQSE